MKTYKIYFRHYDRVLTARAEHFAIENSVVEFYTDGTKINTDFYLLLDAVGAIEAEETVDSSSDRVLTGGTSASGKLKDW